MPQQNASTQSVLHRHRASYLIIAVVVMAALGAAIAISVKNFNTQQDINVSTSADICAGHNYNSALSCSQARASSTVSKAATKTKK